MDPELPTEALSDEALLALVARGDEEAFRVLFRRYAGSFLALARRMGLDGAAGGAGVEFLPMPTETHRR